MSRLSRPAAGLGRGLLGGVAAVAVIGLAACGSVTEGANGQPLAGTPTAPAATGPAALAAGGGAAQDGTGVPLCDSGARLDRVVISRTVGLPTGKLRAAQPGAVTITDVSTVRALAAALCGLSTAPHTPVNCPADFGGGFRLVFSAGGRVFPAVGVESDGCRTAVGLGQVRVAGQTFWRALSAALNGRLPASPGAPASP